MELENQNKETFVNTPVQTSTPQVPPSNSKSIWITTSIIVFILFVITIGSYVLVVNNQQNSQKPNQVQKPNSSTNASFTPTQEKLANIACANPQQDKVVYSKSGDVWVVNVDGTCAMQLTHYGANFNPKLSPKGDYIVYYSLDEKVKDNVLSQTGQYDNTGVNIWSLKTDGTNATKLTDSNTAAHRSALGWSPTGTQIKYFEDGKIIIVNPDGAAKKVVTDLNTIQDLATNTASPIWSPDGRQIAVTAFTKTDLSGLGEGSPSFTQVLIFDLNGKLLNRYINPLRGLSYWSPTNNKLYFIDGTNGIGAYGLESINLDGTNKEFISGQSPNNLSSHSNQPSLDVANSAIYGADESIAVSKDGKMVATIRNEWYSESKTNSPLWIMNIDGSKSHAVNLPSKLSDQLKSGQLTTNNGSDTISLRAIQWMPDNQHLILQVFTNGFGAAVGGHPDRSSLYSIKIDGTGLQALDSSHTVSIKAPYIISDDEISTGVETLY